MQVHKIWFGSRAPIALSLTVAQSRFPANIGATYRTTSVRSEAGGFDSQTLNSGLSRKRMYTGNSMALGSSNTLL